MKLVSVIVPTFNSFDHVSKLCESILSQTYKNLEVIIVDNYSSDNTLEEIKKKNSDDKRFKYFKIKNRGIIAKSRNFGIKNSTGDYIAFHDSDDFWFNNKIEKSLEYIIDHDFTYHHLLIENKKNFFQNNRKLFSYQLSNKPFVDLMTKGNPISTSSVLCRKNLFTNTYFLFSEEKKLVTIEDYDCWINLSKNKFKFKEIPFVLGKYHIGQNNTSLKKNYDYKILHIFNKNKKFLSPSETILAKNHFRYLLANSINKKYLKLKFFYYLFLQKNIKISKVKIIIKIFCNLF